jgi:hypothetical protein
MMTSSSTIKTSPGMSAGIAAGLSGTTGFMSLIQ